MNSGVYIHIPFCEQRCYYCAFTVAVTPESTYAPYAGRLVREVEMSDFHASPSTIYFGGGTPSIVPATYLRSLLECFSTMPAEVTVEANPGTLSREKLAEYRAIGITRISLGAQSLEDEDLQRAGRLHKAAAVLDDFALLRQTGFDNLNLDLIAGLPEQRLETWTRNLDRAIALRPEHISVYMLDVEERSAWGKHIPALPNDEDFAAFYTEAEARLDAAGYVHYEISNWALPGYECRHNLGYWMGAPYRGFGVGAHSYDGNRRYWNTSSLAEYAERIDAGRLPSGDEETITPRVHFEEAFLLGLRQTCGFDIHAAAQRSGVEYAPDWFERLHQLRLAGFVEFDGAVLKLTSAGRLIANDITQELLWPTNSSSTFEATR